MAGRFRLSRFLRWAGIALVMAIVFSFSGQTPRDDASLVAAFQAALQRQAALDKTTAGQYMALLNSDASPAQENVQQFEATLSSSPFQILLEKNDTLLFWTDCTTQAINTGHSEAIFRIDTGAYTAKATWQGMQACQALAPFDKVIGNDLEGGRVHTVRIGNQNIAFSVLDHPRLILYRGLGWLCFFVFFALTGMWLGQRFFYMPKRSNGLILMAWLAGGKIACFLPAMQSWFDGFFLIKPTSQSTLLAPNLGHLIVDIWIIGLLLFIFASKQALLVLISAKTGPRWLAFSTGIFTFIAFSTGLYLMAQFMMHPGVELESETLMQFDATSFVFVTALILYMLLVFLGTHLLHEQLTKSKLPTKVRFGWLSIGWIAGVLVYIVAGLPDVPVWMLLLFVAAYSLMLDAYCETREKKVTYLIWWLMLFSAFVSVGLFYFGLQKDILSRESFPATLIAPTDKTMVGRLEAMQDSLFKGNVFTTIGSLDAPARLDRNDLYEFIFRKPAASMAEAGTSIELFEKKSGTTLFQNHFADYYKLRQLVDQSTIAGKNIYHNPFEDTYFIRFEIARSVAEDDAFIQPESNSWYLFVVQEGALAPKLNKQKHQMHRFGYACFSHNQLIDRAENGESVPDATLLASIQKTAIKHGYSFVVSHPTPQYKIVSWKKVSGLIKPISLFSYLFTLAGLIMIVLALIHTRVPFLPTSISMKFGDKSSLKTRIQLAVIVLILVTFFVIGAITAFYFQNLIQANQAAKNEKETTSIVQHIRSDIQHFADEDYALSFLRSKLKDLSDVHGKELTLYDQFGQITGSTQKGKVRWLLPFGLVHPSGTNLLRKNSEEEKNTKTEFVPIALGNGRPFAYVAIHHLASDASSGSIINFLSTILNAYIFLFLIAGAIAITIANSITQPLTILAEKLKKFKLGKSNELLEWNSQDEIGTLITDYNNLTQELERSAGLLAKTERDMAWREMAKQVAHEIKNPLTPMKLSIQYLERAAKDQPEKAQEMIPKISLTLIEQIDNLSQIANEFSNFASMPQATNEKVVLNEIVETIHDLFRKRDDMDINMIEPIDDLTVFADKHHLVRILNNLLKNAIQAIPETRRGKIEIELKREDGDAVIRISDNGSGIPDSMKEKVFTPNFTTKNSGTGLGLAISANMIESFNGKIYFETIVGAGTDFYIRIPLMRLDDYREDSHRVELD